MGVPPSLGDLGGGGGPVENPLWTKTVLVLKRDTRIAHRPPYERHIETHRIFTNEPAAETPWGWPSTHPAARGATVAETLFAAAANERVAGGQQRSSGPTALGAPAPSQRHLTVYRATYLCQHPSPAPAQRAGSRGGSSSCELRRATASLSPGYEGSARASSMGAAAASCVLVLALPLLLRPLCVRLWYALCSSVIVILSWSYGAGAIRDS
ncbi:hypothetical protein PCL_00122 [Purpureocillium lilacinum]|uniref:Uncharacterized protein n=1 Tax=Purpureocillium lilacinum TaxID=33203 RepID=A0A2U3E622_PURLI|nr:hypothetical protein PCL_00122 [Purpureocillium lilacinum]